MTRPAPVHDVTMTTATRRRPRLPGAPPAWRWVTGAAVVAVGVLVAALAAGGGGTAGPVPGLSDPGGVVRWGLPVAKVIFNAAGAVTVGLVLLAVMLPAPRDELGGDALRVLRSAAITALVWAAAAAAVGLLTLSELLGVPLLEAVSGQSLLTYTQSMGQGQAYASVFVLALAIVPAAQLTISRGGAIGVLFLAVGTFVPPALAGHAGTGDYHHSAQVSLLVHGVAISLWVGGLIALSWYAAQRGGELARLVRGYSSVALGCFVLVAASGVLNGWVRISSLTDLVTTAYGWLLLGKVAALAALGCFGARHRARTIPALDAGQR
ncbi:MAG: copper resistance protein CopD, partial [Propionibacteriales bacterium]|nr:copper resistance protein CopD [Propionibacteriales bacterium]